MSKRTCRLVTLGCKVNQYETQLVKQALEANGYREAEDGEPAELCVVNTCTVTMEGDAKSRQTVRRLHVHNPDARIVVMGCYATRDPAAVARLPGVSRVVTDKERLPEEMRDFGVLHWPTGISRFDGHQRAFVKVQDGCLLNCSFCIIPSVRPVVRSRPIPRVVDEVAELVRNGVEEIVLTGIHLGHYGIDLSKGRPRTEWQRLWHLVEALDALPGEFRIRLSSLEAAEVRDDLVGAVNRARRVVPHFHLCLQSGSDRILQRMKRRYSVAGFVERCRRIQEAFERPAFTTDVIVGFPGESEADFEATCAVAAEMGFSRIHVFSWSPREGTPAASYPERVPAEVVARRRERLRRLETKLAQRYCESLAGLTLDVMLEGEDPNRTGHGLGTACRYVPVSFPKDDLDLVGRRLKVFAREAVNGVVLGERIEHGNDRGRFGRLQLAVV